MIKVILDFLGTKPGLLLIGAIAVIVGGAYSLGVAVGDKELKVYEAASKIDFPTFSRQATDAATELRQAIKEFSSLLATNQNYQELKVRFDKLDAEATGLKSKNELLEKTATDATTNLKKVQDELDRITMPDRTHQIPEKKAIVAGGGLLNIGYPSSYPATINVNGKQQPVAAGDVIISDPEQYVQCRIRVGEVSSSYLTVTASCAPKAR